MLSERQRLALVRGVSSLEHTKARKQKEVTGSLSGKTVHIDGLNTHYHNRSGFVWHSAFERYGW